MSLKSEQTNCRKCGALIMCDPSSGADFFRLCANCKMKSIKQFWRKLFKG
ncbi:MAG: hypothetical protein K2Y14_02835 [Burkholderiales bacterium]|nr:hypothetical protein [Burkholderiales bacterium]